jgi:hypothetical protein
MLSTPHDEDLFDYYATAQLAYAGRRHRARSTPAGKPGIFEAAEPSPDGTESAGCPGAPAVLVPASGIPFSALTVEVWDRAGQNCTSLPTFRWPIAFRWKACARVRAPIEWRPDEPATLAVGGSHGRRQSQGERRRIATAS